MPKPHQSKATTAPTNPTLKPIRVLISSQHTLVRSGIRALLERIEEVEVSEAPDDQQILTQIREFNPHVILRDIISFGLSGLELLSRVTQEFPAARLIALTQGEDEEQAVEVLRLGASGVIAKTGSHFELELAIKTVASGEYYLSETLGLAVLKRSADPRAYSSELTTRQYEVLKMMTEGYGMKEIAVRLNISTKTVETHRARLMERLKIHDIAGLVRYAVRMGLIRLDE
jgi:DNA-binding NarL/FixJ family response regulator